MRNIKTKKKLIMLAMAMALSIPMAAIAQGGLFQRGEEPTRSGEATALTNQGFGNPMNESDVTNQTFGHPIEGVNVTNQTFGTPLGDGLFILLLAGAGYVATSKQKKQQK